MDLTQWEMHHIHRWTTDNWTERIGINWKEEEEEQEEKEAEDRASQMRVKKFHSTTKNNNGKIGEEPKDGWSEFT